MMKHLLLIAALISGLFLKAEAFNTVAITAETLKAFPRCVHYQIKGFCVWVSPIIGVNTTPYIEDYSPDLVVSVFNKAGDNPWTEINATLDQAGRIAQKTEIKAVTDFNAGSGQQSFLNEHEQALFFKEADVIGNPALAVLPKLGLLPSTAVPLKPYFQSMLDSVLWRGLTAAALPEEAATFVTDVKYYVGKFPINWGSLYPHQGSLVGMNDATVAEVIALRAAHLITLPFAERFGHIAQTLSIQCGEACTASSIEPNQNDTQFQRLVPAAQSSCHVLGSSLNETDGLSAQTNGAYLWIVWRKYEGCMDGEGQLVDKVIF